MISSRRLPWLFALLLLFAQHAGVLHQLGHGLGDAARVLGASAAVQAPESGDLPGTESHSGSCLLCLGLGGPALAGLPAGNLPLPDTAFARPLADVSGPAPVAARGSQIRGPPVRFSAQA